MSWRRFYYQNLFQRETVTKLFLKKVTLNFVCWEERKLTIYQPTFGGSKRCDFSSLGDWTKLDSVIYFVLCFKKHESVIKQFLRVDWSIEWMGIMGLFFFHKKKNTLIIVLTATHNSVLEWSVIPDCSSFARAQSALGFSNGIRTLIFRLAPLPLFISAFQKKFQQDAKPPKIKLKFWFLLQSDAK